VNIGVKKNGRRIDSGRVKIPSKRERKKSRSAKSTWISPSFPANICSWVK
jgi:hypothetical protein